MNLFTNPYVNFICAGYFISDKPWIHPDKTEQTYELIYVTRGTVNMHDDLLGEISLQENGLVLLEPDCRHYGTAFSENVRFYWVHFKINNSYIPFKKRMWDFFEQGHLFREILHLSNLPEMPEYEITAVLLHILSELCRISESNDKFNQSAEKIYEWIRINATPALNIMQAAQQFNYSKDHITRILNTTYGCGFKKLSDKFIILKAKNLLLNTELYVKEIAYTLGFSSDKAFITFFKYHEGISPTDFKNKFSKIHMNNI